MAHIDNDFDEGFKERLEQAESPVSPHLFESLMEKRALQSAFGSLESPVPPHLFESLMAARSLQEQVNKGGYGWPLTLLSALSGIILALLCLSFPCNVPSSESIIPHQKEATAGPQAPLKGLQHNTNTSAMVGISEQPDALSKKEVSHGFQDTPPQYQTKKDINKTKNTFLSDKKAVQTALKAADTITTQIRPLQTPPVATASETVRSGADTALITLKNILKTLAIVVKPTWGPRDGCSDIDLIKPKKTVKPTLNILLEGGGSWVNRPLAAQNGDTTALLALRTATEKPLHQIQTRLLAEWQWTPHWSVQIGIGTTHVTEKMQRDSNGVTSPKISYRYIPKGNGQFDTVVSAVATQSGIYRNIRYNRLHTIDLPLAVGYTQAIGQRWQVGLFVGAYVNIATARKADMLNANNQLVNYSSSWGVANPIFKQRLGLSTALKISFAYALTPKIALTLVPEWRQQWQSITLDSYGLSQRYGFLGGSMGIKTSF